LEVLFYATVPVHLTVLDYNTDSLDAALQYSEYPLPVPPSFKKPTADAPDQYAYVLMMVGVMYRYYPLSSLLVSSSALLLTGGWESIDEKRLSAW